MKNNKHKKIYALMLVFAMVINFCSPVLGVLTALDYSYFGDLFGSSGYSSREIANNAPSVSPVGLVYLGSAPDAVWVNNGLWYNTPGIYAANGDEYIITTVGELYYLSTLVSSGVDFAGLNIDVQGEFIASDTIYGLYSGQYVLDLRYYDGETGSAVSSDMWEPIGTPASPFQGCLYSSTGVNIINLTVPVDKGAGNAPLDRSYFGLFGYVGSNALIGNDGINPLGLNLTIMSAPSSSSSRYAIDTTGMNAAAVGGFAAYNYGRIENITASGPIYPDGYGSNTVGGVVGVNSGVIENISFSGSITTSGSTNIAGGLVGENTGSIISGTSSATMTFQSQTAALTEGGGIAGSNAGSGFISGCLFNGTLTNVGEAMYIGEDEFRGLGGITGYNSATIDGCDVRTDLILNLQSEGVSSAGGITGANAITGLINNCTYSGDIESRGEIWATGVAATVCGIGGIAGYSFGTITYCMATSNISFGKSSGDVSSWGQMMTGHYKAGGIAGFLKQKLIQNCIFNGSLKANASNDTYLGGIVGYAGYTSGSGDTYPVVNCCIAAAEIVRVHAAAGGGAGGIIGFNYYGRIFNSIGMGSVTAFARASGVTPFNYGVLSNNYYAGAVHMTGDVLNASGGLLGTTYGTANNMLFTGSVFSSFVGTICGSTQSASLIGATGATLEYDSTISPHYVDTNFTHSETSLNPLKTTSFFDGFKYNDVSAANVGSVSGNQWVAGTATHYPQFSWAANINSGYTDYDEAVRYFNEISSLKWVIVDSSNAVSNTDGAYTVYQMKRSSLTGALKNTTMNGISSSGWSVTTDYLNQNDTSQSFGGVYTNTLTFTSKLNFSVDVSRKLLYAVEETDYYANVILTPQKMLDFLNSCYYAGRSYLASEFFLGANIDMTGYPVMQTNIADTNNYIFSGRFDGQGYKISNLTFDSTASSLFYISKSKYIHIKNIDFENVVFVSNNILTVGYGTLFSQYSSGTIENININGFTMHIGDYTTSKDDKILRPSGGLIGDRAVSKTTTANMTIANVNITGLDIVMDVYRIWRSVYWEMMIGVGGVGGVIGNGTVDNCHVEGNISIRSISSFNYGTTPPSFGGIFGYARGSTISNCSFVGDISGQISGGIIGRSDANTTISDCYAIAELTSPSDAAKRDSYAAGGITGWIGNNSSLSGSFSMGNITGVNVGGLIGIASSTNLDIRDSYSRTMLYSEIESAGGLVGRIFDGGMATVSSSYYIGQIDSNATKGGIIGKKGTSTVSISNSYYDQSIMGKSFTDVGDGDGSTSAGASSADITVSALSNSFGQSTGYPFLLTAIGGTAKDQYYATFSTEFVFEVDPGASLGSEPTFTLQNDNSLFSTYKYIYSPADERGIAETWSDILTNPAANQYGMANNGYTYFDVTFIKHDATPLTLKYRINVKPFDYGEGTQLSPYIIYDEIEFFRFKNFLDNGFDGASTYYKIGSVVNGIVVGDPITLDLAIYGSWATLPSRLTGYDLSALQGYSSDWEPIIGLAGNLNGNGSTITNVIVSTGTTISTTDTKKYYGLFATSAGSANVYNLNIDNVRITISRSGDIGGGFIASASGGTYTDIALTNIEITATNSAIPVGGLIGTVPTGNASINNVYAFVDIKSTASGNPGATLLAGGLVGSAEGVTINESAAYGQIDRFSAAGGLVGTIIGGELNITTIADSLSMVDISSSRNTPIIGGIIGNVTTENPTYYIRRSYAAGKFFYLETSPVDGYIGGIVGSETFLSRYATGLPTISYGVLVQVYGDGEADLYPTKEALDSYVLDVLDTHIFDCYYNFEYNHIGAVGVTYRYTYSQYNAEGTTGSYSTTYRMPSDTYTFSQSNTAYLSDGTLPENFDSGKWSLTEGLYPIHTANAANSQVILNSIAINFINADKFGDTTYVNAYIGYPNAEWSITNGNNVKLATDGQMVISLEEGTEFDLILEYGSLSRTMKYTPSVISCGVPDISWFYFYENGMKIKTRTTESASGTETITEGVWELYTSDQVAGLAYMLDGESDGNLLSANFYGKVIYSDEEIDGIVSLEHDVDFSVYDSDHEMYYKMDYIPVGSDDHPLESVFDGNGYVAESFTQSIPVFGKVTGEIKRFGLASGLITVESGDTTGSIVGNLAGGRLTDSFSSIVIESDEAIVKAGGLAGIAGSNAVIENCFFNGYIFFTGEQSSAGGILANATSQTYIISSYTAGFVYAVESEPIAVSGTGNISATRVFHDPSGYGIRESAVSSANSLPAFTSGWATNSGLYPIQDCFNSRLDDKIRAYAAYLNLTNARATNAGSVSAPNIISQHSDEAEEGTLFLGVITVSGDGRSFEKNESQNGLVIIKISNSSAERYAIANMICWYDNYVLEGTKKIYTIFTAQELHEFAMIVNGTVASDPFANPNEAHTHTIDSFAGHEVRLGANIDLSEYTENDVQIVLPSIGAASTPFAGTFNGDGYAIENISSSGGLFGYVTGTVTNTALVGGAVTGDGAGSLVKTLAGTLSSSFSTADVVSSGTSGGLVGTVLSGGTVSNSFYMGEISGATYSGGIAGVNNGSISASHNVGKVSASLISAGIAAAGSGSITNCMSAGYIDAADTNTTRFIISPSGTVTDCTYDPDMIDMTESRIERVAWANGIYQINNSLSLSELYTKAYNLSVMKMSFGAGESYQFFSSGAINRYAGSDIVSLTSTANVQINPEADKIRIYPGTTTGALTLYSKLTTADGVEITRPYLVICSLTLSIKYKFDYSSILADLTPVVRTPVSSFTTAGLSHDISTPADFAAFVDFVNSSSTVGHTFNLMNDIDMSSAGTLSPIGSDTNPFAGTFEGNGFEISNLNVTGTGEAALFGTIAQAGKVQNVKLQNLSVTANAAGSAVYASAIVAKNYGSVAGIGVVGEISVNNALFAGDSYIGALAALNYGNISSSYFRQVSANVNECGIMHNSTRADYVGLLLGKNEGSARGCYVVTNIRTNVAKAICGESINGTLYDCYFNIAAGDSEPGLINYLYNDVPYTPGNDYFVPQSTMQSELFAEWLSRTMYGGTYEYDPALNSGYPEFFMYKLSDYDMSGYFEDDAIMLTVWTTEGGDSLNRTYMNGLVSYHTYSTFKFFKPLIMELSTFQFSLSIKPMSMEYTITKATIYGLEAKYQTLPVNYYSTSNSTEGIYTLSATNYVNVDEPNIAVFTIKLEKNDIYENLWGVYRER